MNFVKLANKLLNESLVERDVPHVFTRAVLSFDVLSVSDYLGLQQEEVLVSNLVLEIFAEQVSQESSNFELHASIHRANLVIIDY